MEVAVAATEVEVGEAETPLLPQEDPLWAQDTQVAGRRKSTLWTTPRRLHMRSLQNEGVPHAMGTVLQPQPSLEHYGSTIFEMHAVSHLL